MRILMLGNSLTFYNDMPARLAGLIGAEVTAHTRGGARLSEHINPKTELGSKTLPALETEPWDYVILQEMSNAPITSKAAFLRSISALCEKIHNAGATPLLFATWAYQKGSPQMEKMDISYDVMAAQMAESYREAAEQNDALLAEVGTAFYEHSKSENLYADDGCHPNEAGSKLAAEIIAAVILDDQKKRSHECPVGTLPKVAPEDLRLRILYLLQLLRTHTDPEHPLSTKQIQDWMLNEHGIKVHRTTVPNDVALLRAAGIPAQMRRSRVMLYYMDDSEFELAELKILVDAVESSKFITEKKSRTLVKKLTALTNEQNAEKLTRHLQAMDRVKCGNEKGYYIVDAINEAINAGFQISFFYTDYDANKQVILRNDGRPYTVSPYTLIWNGDYYYLVGWYHEAEHIRTFRVDRILTQPDILDTPAQPKPKGFDLSHYTKEVFRMYDTDELVTVTLLCENEVMKGVIDKFGIDVTVKKKNKAQFTAKVDVCPSPTFFGWVFQWAGKVRIGAPESVVEQYCHMVRNALE